MRILKRKLQLEKMEDALNRLKNSLIDKRVSFECVTAGKIMTGVVILPKPYDLDVYIKVEDEDGEFVLRMPIECLKMTEVKP